MSDTICCLLPIILLVLLPLNIIGAWRWWSMRSMASRFEMDGAVCLEPKQGNVVIRRTRIRNILLLTFFGAVGIGLLALLPAAVRDLVTGDNSWETIERFSALPIALIIIGAAIVLLARSAFLPNITFDQQNRVLLIGRGASERRIPFSDLSRQQFQLWPNLRVCAPKVGLKWPLRPIGQAFGC